MKINLTAVAVGISLAVTASQTTAADQQLVDINDLKSNSSKTYNCSGLNCLLRMATFSSEKYAIRYKENLATKTTQPVRVERDQKNHNLFHVVVGPFDDFAKMLQNGAILTGKAIKPTSQMTKNTNTSPSLKSTAPTPVVNSTTKVQNHTNTSSIKAADLTSNITKPIAAVANLFKISPRKTETTKHINKKRTIAVSTTNTKASNTYSTKRHLTKHEQILASQADYPVNQNPKVDAKGNVIPIFKAGPYVGASAGVQSNIAKAPATVAYQSFNGTLSAGAGRMFTHRFYMAGEFYLGDNIKAKSFTSGVSGYAINSGINYGGDFIPGYMITDTVLGYLRVGGMRALFDAIPTTRPFTSGFIPQYGRRLSVIVNGWQVGLGTQTNLYKNLDGRAEYVYTQFQGTAIEKTKGFMSQVNVGLVYKFTDALHRA